MRLIKKLGLILSLMLIPVLMASCGTNLAGDKGIDRNDTSAAGIANRVDLAKDRDDFLDIVEDSTRILERGGLPPTEESGILHSRAQARLAADDMTLLGIVADIESIASDEDDETGNSTIFDSLDQTASRTSTTNLRSAADDANRSSSLMDGVVDTNRELDRGVMNLLVVNNMLTSVYDIEEDDDGDLTTQKRNEDQSNAEVLDSLFDPPAGEPITTYFDSMDQAFGNTDILDDEADGEINSMSTALADLEALNQAIDDAAGGSATITVNGQPRTFNTSDDDAIGAEIDFIFEQAFD